MGEGDFNGAAGYLRYLTLVQAWSASIDDAHSPEQIEYALFEYGKTTG